MASITLTTEQALVQPAATWIEWKEINIDISSRTMSVKYVWHGSAGVVPVNGRVEQVWSCANDTDDPLTPENEADPKFNSIFNFVIREADVGKRVGKSLMALIWAKMKTNLLTGENDGTISDE